MSALTVFPADQPEQGNTFSDFATIADQVKRLGAQFERWQADCPFSADDDADAVLQAYSSSIDKLKQEYGFQSVDVISVTPDHPNKTALREKFLAEHVHSDFEVRFFVEGCGLFYLHIDDKVYAILCEKGDLISVPAGIRHWFDMGENPQFKCIRLFTTEDGWLADFTGDPIGQDFPTLDQYLLAL